MTAVREGSPAAHLRVRVVPEQQSSLRALARKRQTSMSHLLRSAIARELEASVVEGSLPDESAVREMAILIAVELVLKLQETTIPGGITRSRQLLESAARAAINRIETVEASLVRQAER
jgi:post-segregation antitoxin (ccd killing protein)